MLKAGVVQQECKNALFPFYLGLPLISLRFALLWSLTPRSVIRQRALFTIRHHIHAFHSPEHMILNGNAFRQNYENYCSGKVKDQTKQKQALKSIFQNFQSLKNLSVVFLIIAMRKPRIAVNHAVAALTLENEYFCRNRKKNNTFILS